MCFTKLTGPSVEISGVATLCFNEEGTWFQGAIATDDDSQFAISGTKSLRKRMGQEQFSASENVEYPYDDEGDRMGIPVTFDIKIVDCELGDEYSLRKVHGRNGELCTFSCSSISFTTDHVYRGQKADMVSQRCLGHKMAGKRTSVYQGPISIICSVSPKDNIRWVL